MIVVLPIVFAFGVLLLWALYAEEVEPEPDLASAPPWPAAPTPADVAQHRFPLSPLGYDRDRVNAHLQRAAELVADLQARLAAAEAPPEPLPARWDEPGDDAGDEHVDEPGDGPPLEQPESDPSV